MMGSVMHYERIEPAQRCASPDGHDYVECMILSSPIPDEVVCPRCGEQWTIVVFDDGA